MYDSASQNVGRNHEKHWRVVKDIQNKYLGKNVEHVPVFQKISSLFFSKYLCCKIYNKIKGLKGVNPLVFLHPQLYKFQCRIMSRHFVKKWVVNSKSMGPLTNTMLLNSTDDFVERKFLITNET